MLLDHANCELKAASTALGFLYRYPERTALAQRMSRLAREELRHFEQVRSIMQEMNIPFARLRASRYAGALRDTARPEEPFKLLDMLLIGALIEARSCERFAKIAPRLPEKLKWELDRFEVEPSRLAVEILESVVADSDNDVIVHNIAALARMGCMIDLDDFKAINDSYGHQLGDKVLQSIAWEIKGSLRQYDSAARFGGEEFALLLPETALKGANLVAERLRTSINSLEFAGPLIGLKITVSIGVAAIPNDKISSVSDLIRLADDALYAAKHNGRNRVESSTPA